MDYSNINQLKEENSFYKEGNGWFLEDDCY